MIAEHLAPRSFPLIKVLFLFLRVSFQGQEKPWDGGGGGFLGGYLRSQEEGR